MALAVTLVRSSTMARSVGRAASGRPSKSCFRCDVGRTWPGKTLKPHASDGQSDQKDAMKSGIRPMTSAWVSKPRASRNPSAAKLCGEKIS